MSAKSHSDRLKRMANARQAVARKLYQAGQLVELDAEQSITEGSISGAGHVPSEPGQPPNADTRFLDSNIETEIGGPGIVTVTSKAPYSAALEFGTDRGLEERPFMRPALQKNRAKIVKMVGEAIRTTIK